MEKLFYRPDNAWFADAIPFYEDGLFHIFYLLDWRDPAKYGIGTPWYQVTTRDFVKFRDCGEMLARGTQSEYDMYVFTGSVLKDPDGLYHIWYTGHNTCMEAENYVQAVMHAVSNDLKHWTKVPEDTFVNLSEDYETHDWRDPFVWYDEKERLYKMLLSTRKKCAEARRRGTTALLISEDNKSWRLSEPLWEPHLFYAHECPDLFRIGDWYYHIYSEFSHYHVTRYVMSRSENGPWIMPDDDKFDGRAFYAAKTVSDGKKRYLLGWNPTKEGNTDSGLWQWGGSLVVHELVQRRDGTLACRMPKAVDRVFKRQEELSFTAYDGTRYRGETFRLGGTGCEAVCAIADQAQNGVYRFDVEFTFEKGTQRIGILLNADREKDFSYGYFFEPAKNRMVFELFPNFPQYSMNAICVERPVKLREGRKYRVSVIVDGTICVAYCNNEYALNARMYDGCTGYVGLMVQGGATFDGICIKK